MVAVSSFVAGSKVEPPIGWQRHHAGVRALVFDRGTAVDEITPGVTVHSADIGGWLHRQREAWTELSQEQCARLAELGGRARAGPDQERRRGRGIGTGRGRRALPRP